MSLPNGALMVVIAANQMPRIWILDPRNLLRVDVDAGTNCTPAILPETTCMQPLFVASIPLFLQLPTLEHWMGLVCNARPRPGPAWVKDYPPRPASGPARLKGPSVRPGHDPVC